MKASLVLFNAQVLTMDPSIPKAGLIALRGERIWKVTRKEELKELTDRRTKVIDCEQRTVLPGFNDAHCHLSAFAESLVTLPLSPSRGITSIPHIQGEIKRAAQERPPGTWIRAGGYDEFYLKEKRHPTRFDLDPAAPAHPVKITHRSGHAHVLNTLGLKLAGISEETPDPAGGLIDRDLEAGKPTGVLYGMGEFLSKRIPALDRRELERGVRAANQQLLSSGITSIQDASARNDLQSWQTFERWKDRGWVKSRISMLLGVRGFKEHPTHAFRTHLGERQLRLGGVKIILNETTGQLHPSQEDLTEWVFQVHQSNLPAVIHALEETTIQAACSAFEQALRRSPRRDPRHRIDHCSVCPPSLAGRLGRLGLMVATQPAFIFHNGDRYLKTVPAEQLEYLYPLASLLRAGVSVAGSSDCPIAPVSPLTGIYAATSRLTKNGDAVSPGERLGPLEALGMYTVSAARTTFEEKAKGSITPGYLADMVVLSDNPAKLPAEEIKDIKVEMTIINGEVVWDRMGST